MRIVTLSPGSITGMVNVPLANVPFVVSALSNWRFGGRVNVTVTLSQGALPWFWMVVDQTGLLPTTSTDPVLLWNGTVVTRLQAPDDAPDGGWLPLPELPLLVTVMEATPVIVGVTIS